jgi:hypothetical protein
LELREDPIRGNIVQDLTEKEVFSPIEIMNMLLAGNKNRT